MKIFGFICLYILLSIGFANEYCESQKLYGFEDAVFLFGENVVDDNPQEVINELLVNTSWSLVQVDTFMTRKSFFQLLRVKDSNELILMTTTMQHVCFYLVPSSEPVRHSSDLT